MSESTEYYPISGLAASLKLDMPRFISFLLTPRGRGDLPLEVMPGFDEVEQFVHDRYRGNVYALFYDESGERRVPPENILSALGIHFIRWQIHGPRGPLIDAYRERIAEITARDTGKARLQAEVERLQRAAEQSAQDKPAQPPHTPPARDTGKARQGKKLKGNERYTAFLEGLGLSATAEVKQAYEAKGKGLTRGKLFDCICAACGNGCQPQQSKWRWKCERITNKTFERWRATLPPEWRDDEKTKRTHAL